MGGMPHHGMEAPIRGGFCVRLLVGQRERTDTRMRVPRKAAVVPRVVLGRLDLVDEGSCEGPIACTEFLRT